MQADITSHVEPTKPKWRKYAMSGTVRSLRTPAGELVHMAPWYMYRQKHILSVNMFKINSFPTQSEEPLC